jgi:adenylate cyclase
VKLDRRRAAAFRWICLWVLGAALLVFLAPHAVPHAVRAPSDPNAWWWVGPRFEGRLHDQLLALGRPAPTHPDLRFVAIDAGSLAPVSTPEELADSRGLQLIQNGWPWSREVYALLADKLLNAGAKLVVFDLLFGPARDGDPEFRAALERHRERVLVGANLTPSSFSQDAAVPATFQGVSPTLLPQGSEQDPRIGSVNFIPEGHGTVWRVPFHLTLSGIDGGAPYPQEERYATLTTRVLERVGMAPDPAIEARLFRYQSPDAYRAIPVQEILNPSLWERNLGNGSRFRGAIVLIGPGAPEFHDYVQTPFGNLEGPRVHLHAMGAALQGAFYHQPGALLVVLLTAAGAVLGILPAFRLRDRPITGLICIFGGAVLYFWLAWAVYSFGSLLLPLSAPLAALCASGVLGIGYEFGLEQREKARVRRIFESYVSRNVARAILDNRDEVMQALGGSRKPMALLFSDLRGFTALSEHADPVQLVAQLNEYLGAMVDIVFRHDGTLDKFIGDAVMGVWGNLTTEAPAINAERAVRTAHEMRLALDRLNVRWRAEGRREFAFGIGIHHGEAVFGNIGSEQKKEPTAIGDAVNLASRLEGVTKFCGVDIVLSEAVEEAVRGKFRLMPLGALRVVGRSRPVGIFWLAGLAGEPHPLETVMAEFAGALADYRARRFEAARARFEAHPADAPAAKLAALYADRCRTHAGAPPPDDWDGSESMAGK